MKKMLAGRMQKAAKSIFTPPKDENGQSEKKKRKINSKWEYPTNITVFSQILSLLFMMLPSNVLMNEFLEPFNLKFIQRNFSVYIRIRFSMLKCLLLLLRACREAETNKKNEQKKSTTLFYFVNYLMLFFRLCRRCSCVYSSLQFTCVCFLLLADSKNINKQNIHSNQRFRNGIL